jgi:hypothetical protein
VADSPHAVVVVVVLSTSLFSASTSLVVLRVPPLCVCAVLVLVAPSLVWLTVFDPLARCPCAVVVFPEWLADTDPRDADVVRCATSAALETASTAAATITTVRMRLIANLPSVRPTGPPGPEPRPAWLQLEA